MCDGEPVDMCCGVPGGSVSINERWFAKIN
jgi:hypothetical protein